MESQEWTSWFSKSICIVNPNGRSAVGCSGNAIWSSYYNAKSTPRVLTFVEVRSLQSGVTIAVPNGRSGSGCPESCIWTYYSNVSREVENQQFCFSQKRYYSKPRLLLRSRRCPRSRETYIYTVWEPFGNQGPRKVPPQNGSQTVYIYIRFARPRDSPPPEEQSGVTIQTFSAKTVNAFLVFQSGRQSNRV